MIKNVAIFEEGLLLVQIKSIALYFEQHPKTCVKLKI